MLEYVSLLHMIVSDGRLERNYNKLKAKSVCLVATEEVQKWVCGGSAFSCSASTSLCRPI